MTSIAADKVIVSKYRGGTQEGWFVGLNGATGNLEGLRERATSDQSYISNNYIDASGTSYAGNVLLTSVEFQYADA
jgi:hypothetical protein